MARALATVFPYSPKYRKNLDHPALGRMYEMGRLMPWQDLTDGKTRKEVLEHIARDARDKLEGKKVYHFEVVVSDGGTDDDPVVGWYAVVANKKTD